MSDQNECSLTNILPLKIKRKYKNKQIKNGNIETEILFIEIKLIENKPHPSGGESQLNIRQGRGAASCTPGPGTCLTGRTCTPPYCGPPRACCSDSGAPKETCNPLED